MISTISAIYQITTVGILLFYSSLLLAVGASELEAELETETGQKSLPHISEGAVYQKHFKPLPKSIPYDHSKALLGQQLFHDSGLASGKASCGTCHMLEKWGADGIPRSIDIQGSFDDMNTLSVFNAVLNFRLMWNGGANSPAEQVDMVMNNDRHMGAGWGVALQYIRGQDSYLSQFNQLYGNVIDQHTVSDAIVNYERTLITPDSPFDRFLLGDNEAISDVQKQGLELFMDYGCVACHQGVNIGGNMFARFGVFVEPYKNVIPASTFDLGRFNVTGKDSDRYVMRVPSLRNVAETAPYFHNGGSATLKGAITRMGYYQLGRIIPDDDVDKIALFLESLTGRQPEPLK